MAALGVAVFVYLPPYFAGHLAVPMAVVGGVWMGVRLFDIPVDVGLAMLMDRTHTPVGRYRFWLMLGAPLLSVSLYKLYMTLPQPQTDKIVAKYFAPDPNNNNKSSN